MRRGELTASSKKETDTGDNLAGAESEGKEEELPAVGGVDEHDRLGDEAGETEQVAGGHEFQRERGELAFYQAVERGADGDELQGDADQEEQQVHELDAEPDGGVQLKDEKGEVAERGEDGGEGNDKRKDRQVVQQLHTHHANG